MFLRAIKLNNYRKFKKQYIEFSEGVIGIIGRNGSGKSSILEAIGWALYGNVMARSDKKEVKRQGAGQGDSCFVEVEFDMAGHVYKVIRELKGKNAISNALVYLDGNKEPEASRDKGVNSYIEKLIGMDYTTFIKTIYAKQKDLAAFSLLTSEERKKMIRRMLNIDKIDLVIVQARKDKRDKDKVIEGIAASFVDVKKLESEKNGLLKNQKSIKKEIQCSKKELEIFSEEKSKIQEEKNTQDSNYKKFNKIKEKINGLSSSYSALEESLDDSKKEKTSLIEKQNDLEKIEPKEQEYEKVKNEKEEQEELKSQYEEKKRISYSIQEKREEMEEIESEIKGNKKKMEEFLGLEPEGKKIEEDIKRFENENDVMERKRREHFGKLKTFETKIEELSSKKAKIIRLGKNSECPTCFRGLGDSYTEIINYFEREILAIQNSKRDIEDEYKDIKIGVKNIKDKINDLVRKKNNVNKKLREKSKLEQSISSKKNELGKTEKKIINEEKRLKSIKGVTFDERRYNKIIRDLKELSKVRDNILGLRREVLRLPAVEKKIKTVGTKLLNYKKEIKKHKTELAKLDFNEEKYDIINKNYKDVIDKFHKAQLKLKDVQNKMNLSKKDISETNEKIKKDKENRNKAKDIKTEIQYLQKLEIAMKDFRLELTGRILPSLETRVSFLFNEVTDGRYPMVKLDDNYEMSIVDDNKAYGLNRFSGGEEDLANLCFRLAVSEVLVERSGNADINFIALDEIFGSQDERRKQNILSSFNRLSSQFRQIFLITHIEEIKEMLPKVLRVEENLTTKESNVTWE